MSYSTITVCASDMALQNRIMASIAQEQKVRGDEVNPTLLLGSMSWSIATASDVEAAYASALAAGNPDPGGDEAVITDGMILANVQAEWPAA